MFTKSNLKKAFIAFGLMVGAVALFSALPAFALSPSDNPTFVSNLTGGETSGRRLVLTLVNYFLGFLGLLAVLMVIYGGVRYVASAGSDDAVGEAKKIILYAVIGLVVVMVSFVLVNTILGAGTNTEP